MTSITPEVTLESEARHWLLRVDGVEIAFVDDYEDAVRAVDSLVVAKVSQYEKDLGASVKVYRQNLEEGRVVKIYTQSIGYVYNGAPRCVNVVDLVPLKKVVEVVPRKLTPPATPEPPKPADAKPVETAPVAATPAAVPEAAVVAAPTPAAQP